MSFENLLKTLEEKARTEEAASLNVAKTEAKKIQAQASEQVKQIMDEDKIEGQRLGNEQRLEINANARLKQKKIIGEARETLLNEAILGIQPLLEEYVGTPAYEKTLLRLAKECEQLLGNGAVLYCKKEDEKKLKSSGLKVAGNVKIIGGVIGETSDGKIKVNNSFETLLEAHWEKLKQTAYKEFIPVVKTETQQLTQKQIQQPIQKEKPVQEDNKSKKIGNNTVKTNKPVQKKKNR